METKMKTVQFSIFLLIAVVLFGAGCSAAPTQVVEPALSPEVQPSASLPLATSTPKPTLPPTYTPTAAEIPTTAPSPTEPSTPTPTFGPAGEGISAWCLPENASLGPASDPANPPAEGKIAQWTGTALEVRDLPSNGCVFIYTFNQPPASELSLQVSDSSESAPFLTAALTPVPGDENSVYALLRHTWIIAPPVWEVSFTFTLTGADGAVVRSDQVNLHRWTPGLCWNGRKPNPLTLRCPLAQDLHPWDPWYGTPMPTGLPEEGD